MSGIEISLRGLPDSSNDELDTLVMPSTKKPEGFTQRLMLSLDEHTSVKLLMRLWGPRLEFFVRLMLLSTFFDDSLHTAPQFFEHTKKIGEQGCLKWLAATSPELVAIIATVALGIGLLAQSLGSICLLALLQPDGATKALIGWTIAQPVLYAQLSNVEFVAESLSLAGGLLMLRAHLVSEQGWHTGARTQLLGRLLLPAVYLYHAGLFLFSALTSDETSNLAMYFSSLSMFIVNTVMLVGLVIVSTLVAAGLKSRFVAVLLALVNLGFVFYQYPFFRFIWLEGGEWKYDEEKLYNSMDNSMSQVALPTDISPSDLDPFQIYNLHRYYFFLGLSTSGALLLLAQFGPGEIAFQKNEILLPLVVRAQD